MRAILTYHSIDESASPISIDPRVFRSQMEFLAAGRPRVVPLADVLQETAPDECVALTFDDAFANFAEFAAPVLADLALPATVFVVTDHVGGKNDWEGPGLSHGSVPLFPLMSWNSIQRLADRGVEIGGHSRRHPRLSAVPAAQLEEETAGCAGKLAATLGVSVTSFAYPYGDLSDAVVRSVAKSYQRACTTDLRALDRADDVMRLPRLDAYYFRASGQLQQWGTAAFQRRLWLRAQARRVRQFVAASAGRA
jgi:peptidoglycan/xylan/chitin deacetylase (PgdA/CDA1 family)